MGSSQEHEAIVRWLSDPASYPHRPKHVDQVETHISRVFLAGPLVYKLKKPVRYDFLDFSTRELREHACREELRLNRRLAPEVYLRVVPIFRGPNDKYQWEGPGEVADWLVEMNRLPTELTLDALYQRGALRPADIDRLAATLVNFYWSLVPLALQPHEYVERYQAHVRGNFRELLSVRHHLPRGAVERTSAFQLQLLALEPELLEARVRGGRVVDGHGDLRPEHICLSDTIAIFDCLEFSADFRRIDIADELAFLATECDFLGADWAGQQVLAAYQDQTGDRPPAMLLDFYRCYRACVRAKVAALRADQLQGARHDAAVREAKKHLALADKYATPWQRPLVLAVGGVAGTGKTTLARALAETFAAELLRTDVIRQELFAGGHRATSDSGDKYGAAARRAVYEDMFRRGAALLADRISVVLDGTFSTVESILNAAQLASGSQVNFLAVECTCRLEVARQRIEKRLAAAVDASEATPEIHNQQKAAWQQWPEEIQQVNVDTERPLTEQIARVVSKLQTVFCSAKHSHTSSP